MTTNARISHKDCDHPKTWAAREKCRRERGLGTFKLDLERSDDHGKICYTCREHKPWDCFARNPSMPSGYARRCKDCQQAAQWKSTYGITREEYDELLEAQGGGCWICGSEDPGIEGRGFSVDHCHQGEVVRGLLCHADNVHTVPGFERLISMGLDPVTAVEKYLAQPRIHGKYTPNTQADGHGGRRLKPKFRAAILEDHGEFCDICESDEPEGNGWQIDHDHLTDEIRGVTCHYCNLYLMNGVDRLLDLDVPLSRVVEYLNQDTGISTAGTRAKYYVARSKTEAYKESRRAARRRRDARKRAEKGA